MSDCYIWITELNLRSASSWGGCRNYVYVQCKSRSKWWNGFSSYVRVYMSDYIVQAIIILSVGWHLQHERMRSDLYSITLTCTVKPTHLQSEPGSSRAPSLCAPSYLPVQDKHTGLGPSTSLQQLTSASVKRKWDRISSRQVLQALHSLSCPGSARPHFPQRPSSPSPDHSPRPH